MNTDEQQIRELIVRWAAAVHAGDLAAVLAHHADDVVMFDVPPPHDGVRGIDAYAETWPPFFDWQASGATFDVVSLDVSASTDTAFAVALLRCGRPEDDSDRRLRLTIGLRKVDGTWLITHEHHSFALDDQQEAEGEGEVRDLHDRWFAASANRDLDATMAVIAPTVVSYEHSAPLQYTEVPISRSWCAAILL